MKKLLLFTLVISAATLGGLWSGKKFCAMTPSSNQALYSGLELSQAQEESIQKLEKSFQRQADELCIRVCRKRVALIGQIKNGLVDRQVIEKEVEAIGQMQIELEKKTAAHLMDVNKILTPSQSALYLERIYQTQCRMTAQNGHDHLGASGGAKSGLNVKS